MTGFKSVLQLSVIGRIVAINLALMAASMLVCTGIALLYSESTVPFLLSALIVSVPAVILYFLSAPLPGSEDLKRKDAYFIVSASWILLGLTGSLPYMLSGSIPAFVDALFESVSGFSTTGASVLTDIEALPYSILFWRSLTHWIGGIGIIILVIVIMPSFRIGGYHLFTMESSLQEKIKPRTRSIGYRLLLIYVALTVAEAVLLLAGGMNLFESVCHSFGTIATGGFSPKNDSIAGYSPYIQYVITLFMLMAGVNFTVYYFLAKREFNRIRDNEEFRFYLMVVASIGLVITAILVAKADKPLEVAFRDAFFQVVSIITCTGFVSADYLQWPVYAWMIIFFSMFIGGSTGSTAGSIKIARHLILLKNIKSILSKMIHPSSIIRIRINKRHLPEDLNQSALAFIALYLIIFAFGSLLLTITGLDLMTASSSTATCMAGIGPGMGTVGPVSNFGHLPSSAKIILSALMILGRLEIYTVLILFTKSFWTH